MNWNLWRNNLYFPLVDFGYEVISGTVPDIIIHCVAYTNVNGAEVEKEDSYNINVIGTENIANSAEICVSKLVFFK